jgi:hypothetical protein
VPRVRLTATFAPANVFPGIVIYLQLLKKKFFIAIGPLRSLLLI